MNDGFSSALVAFSAGPVKTTSAARLVTSLSALDWLAVGRAGATEPVSRLVRDMVLAEGGSAQARIFGSTVGAPVRAAALVNGTASHALDYDDTHFAHIGHPSVAVFPAALAMGEANDKALVEVLEAALVGMEVSIRVGIWLGRAHYQAGFHQTATAGAFGAAVAAGRLLGLDAERMGHALGLTATRAAGLKAQFGTMGKPYNAGIAAATGAEVAQLVGAGFEASADAMDGPFGFGATHHGEAELSGAMAGIGQGWFFENVSHKFHACCHGLHAALEAARDLDIAAPEIAGMSVFTNSRWMSVCNQPAPMTGLGAKFSFRTVLAMRALGYDTARLDSYCAAICADPRLNDLRARIEVHVDDTLSETESRLEVLRRDGAELVARHDLLEPVPLAQREDRVRAKADVLIGPDMAESAWAMLRTGASASDFAALLQV